jgi:glycosyltransferase involved in cell wall biosynthesis
MASVSVIIPTYNRASYIADSITSVLEQHGNHDIEVIVVDDGSTDNTAEIVAKFGQKVRYQKTKPSGKPAVPRNIAIGMASHELIAFQDSDDLWTADKLSAQVGVFDDPEILLSYGNADTMDATGKLNNYRILTKSQGANGDIFEQLVKTNIISTLTVMVRKEALIEAGLFCEDDALRAVEDYALWLRICSKGRVSYIDDVLAHYRLHDANISTAGQVLAEQRLIAVMRTTLAYVSSRQQRELLRRRLVGLYDSVGKASKKSGFSVQALYQRVYLKLHL